MRNLRINKDRLWQSHEDMARIGALPGGGCRRLALTDEDKAGRDLFVKWCREAGCEIRVDQVGNIFARRAGRNDALPPVMTGSHLDTQPHGGRYDGVYGVLAGLEIVRALNDLDVQTEAPIEVAVWTNEEGSRFVPSMVASGVFGGKFTLDEALNSRDHDGKRFGDELERIGYAGDMPCGQRELKAFFEVHIEQGPVLENEGKTIGIVTGAQGQRWYDVKLLGRDAHAGTTPMPLRRDAMAAAARMTVALQELALEFAPDAVATVGELHVSPNSRNTIPGEVDFTVDIRNPDTERLLRMDTLVRERFERIATDAGIELRMTLVSDVPVVRFDEDCIESVRQAVGELGYSSREMVTGAGHDALYVGRVAPASMIHIPCLDGLSHNEAESATAEDLEAGCNVLMHAMLAHAGVAS
ncbi:MAG: Zn-dependent hydrolase [Gammaproteobacteria bacterium]|nr:Zn-dependent hydrolase [Gammaproteobacteria bacterium]